ncbi:MAG: hypothetical protein KGL46_01595 [Hyphomicrobiales bacterium]|nr:hypothetical protein [Hyphomicrobiales bacterium]
MALYRISMHRYGRDAGDMRVSDICVVVRNESEQALAKVDALSQKHANKVALDLMSLLRRDDPEGAFIIDAFVARRALERA